MSETKKMPVLLIAPGSMSAKDIARAQKYGGFCIIECANAEAARFAEPPLGADLDERARAAMQIVRFIQARNPSALFTGGDLIKVFVEALLHDDPIKSVPPTKSVATTAKKP